MSISLPRNGRSTRRVVATDAQVGAALARWPPAVRSTARYIGFVVRRQGFEPRTRRCCEGASQCAAAARQPVLGSGGADL